MGLSNVKKEKNRLIVYFKFFVYPVQLLFQKPDIAGEVEIVKIAGQDTSGFAGGIEPEESSCSYAMITSNFKTIDDILAVQNKAVFPGARKSSPRILNILPNIGLTKDSDASATPGVKPINIAA